MYSAFQVDTTLLLPLTTSLTRLSQSNNDSSDTTAFSIDAPGMRETVDIAALNSRVKFDRTDVPFEERAILGDATETGLIRFAGRYVQDFDAHQKKHPKVFEIPFNSTNKWALVIVRDVVMSASCRVLTSSHLAGQATQRGCPDRLHQRCSRACSGQVHHVPQGWEARADYRRVPQGIR